MSNNAGPLESQVTERLVGEATREYRAILRLIGERQCDSLGDFAMAEHLRHVLTQQQAPHIAPRMHAPVVQ